MPSKQKVQQCSRSQQYPCSKHEPFLVRVEGRGLSVGVEGRGLSVGVEGLVHILWLPPNFKLYIFPPLALRKIHF